MPDPTDLQTEMTEGLMSASEQYTEFTIGLYTRLSHSLPQEETTAAFLHFLDQVRMSQQMELEKLQLQIRIQEYDNAKACGLTPLDEEDEA